MNLSFKGGTVNLYRSIRIGDIRKNVFSVASQLLYFWTKFKGLTISMQSGLIFDLRDSQHKNKIFWKFIYEISCSAYIFPTKSKDSG